MCDKEQEIQRKVQRGSHFNFYVASPVSLWEDRGEVAADAEGSAGVDAAQAGIETLPSDVEQRQRNFMWRNVL